MKNFIPSDDSRVGSGLLREDFIQFNDRIIQICILNNWHMEMNRWTFRKWIWQKFSFSLCLSTAIFNIFYLGAFNPIAWTQHIFHTIDCKKHQQRHTPDNATKQHQNSMKQKKNLLTGRPTQVSTKPFPQPEFHSFTSGTKNDVF